MCKYTEYRAVICNHHLAYILWSGKPCLSFRFRQKWFTPSLYGLEIHCEKYRVVEKHRSKPDFCIACRFDRRKRQGDSPRAQEVLYREQMRQEEDKLIEGAMIGHQYGFDMDRMKMERDIEMKQMKEDRKLPIMSTKGS